MKLFWASNAPFVGSGYGVQSGLFGPRLATLGHDLAYYANWGVQGCCLDWNGFKVYPSDGEWGNRTLVASAAHWADGLDDCQVIALCDAWVLNPDKFHDDMHLAIWAPVDQHPLPQPPKRVLEHKTVTPIAMSRFGERMMLDAGLDPLYVPHGVETDVFQPQPDAKSGVREEMGLPEDAFVVGMVAANQGHPTMHRKAFPQMFQAFARFAEKHADAVLYVHTNELNSQSGLMLRQLGSSCGLTRRNLHFTDVFTWELGWSRETLANAYQAFNVVANATMGEGFGVPIIEAQASGVPVIVSQHSAMTELCGAGWLVEADPYYNGPQDAWFCLPRVESILAALEEAYDNAETMRDAARDFALQYDADTVTERFWIPALAEMGATVTTPQELVSV